MRATLRQSASAPVNRRQSPDRETILRYRPVLFLEQGDRFVGTASADQDPRLQHFCKLIGGVGREDLVRTGLGLVEIARTERDVAFDQGDDRIVGRKHRERTRLLRRKVELAAEERKLGHGAKHLGVAPIEFVRVRKGIVGLAVLAHLELKLAELHPIVRHVFIAMDERDQRISGSRHIADRESGLVFGVSNVRLVRLEIAAS
jgi:hypothetical protein